MSSPKVILITGGNTGLGLEAIKALYASSTPYTILLGSRSTSKGEAAISLVKSGLPTSKSTLTVIQIDISSDSSITKAVETISSKFGHLDVLINNAGGSFDPLIPTGELSIREAFNKSWDTNVSGTHVLTHASVPLLLKSSDPRLLFITSGTSSMQETVEGLLPQINSPPAKGWPKANPANPIEAYRSSKAGLNMLMREWTRILKEDGVKVWAISPGFLATGLAGFGPEELKKMGAQDPAIGGRFIRDVVEGERDNDAGKIVRNGSIQPW